MSCGTICLTCRKYVSVDKPEDWHCKCDLPVPSDNGVTPNEEKPIGMCFVCGKQLRNAVGQPVPGVTIDFHGSRVRAHKVCAEDAKW